MQVVVEVSSRVFPREGLDRGGVVRQQACTGRCLRVAVGQEALLIQALLIQVLFIRVTEGVLLCEESLFPDWTTHPVGLGVGFGADHLVHPRHERHDAGPFSRSRL